MTWKTLFFAFDGRIGRQQWWLAMLTLLAASVVLSFLVNPLAWFSKSAGAIPNLADTLLKIAFLIPETAVTVKRFNDRDWPHFLPYGYAIVGLFIILLDHHHLIMQHGEPRALDLALMVSLLAVFIAIVVDNGLLRGTVGPNRYGPDPLQAEARPAAPSTPADSRP